MSKPTIRNRRQRIIDTVLMLDSFAISISVRFIAKDVVFYDGAGKVQFSEHKSLDDAEAWLNGFVVGSAQKGKLPEAEAKKLTR